jgi:hypothetical protein
MPDRYGLDVIGPMFDQPLPSFVQLPYSVRKCGVEFPRSRVILKARLALLRGQVKIRLDVLTMSLLQSCTLLAHSGQLFGVNIMLPRMSRRSPLGRLLKIQRNRGLRLSRKIA